MKKLLFLVPLAAILCLSCELETSDNGDLDGFWQLKQVDTLQGGTKDMRGSGVFWAVQTDLLEARIGGTGVFFRFSNTGDSLFLSDPYVNNRDSSDIKLTDVARLHELGINELEERFRIMALDGSTMVLQSYMLRLHFRKY